ncbi:hypothetical protein Tco_0962738 [Tanacetum coccineum]
MDLSNNGYHGLEFIFAYRNRRLFTLYKAYDGRHVIFGRNLKGKVAGGGQLCDDNCLASFTKVDYATSKNGKTLAKGLRRNGLYTYKLGDNSKQRICLASVVDNSTLWHRRLGHANMRLVQNLASNELVMSLPKLIFARHFCDTYGLGSQGNANNRTRKGVSTIRVLELLRLDLFGPSSIQSYRGVFLRYSQTSKAYIVLNKETMRFKESLNVSFDKSLPEPKSSSSVEDDRIDEPIVQDLNGSHGAIGKRIPFELEGEDFGKGGAKDSIAIQTCELYKEEFNDFLALYAISLPYHVILPKSNQTVFDAPPGYVELYTHSISISNLRLPLTEFFCEVLEYFQAGKWLTFAKRLEKHIPYLFPKVITRINEIAIRNFVYAEDEEDLSFLPKELSPGFGTGYPSVSVNIKPLRADEELVLQPAEVTVDSGGSPKPKLFVVHPGSVVAWIKDRKCKTRGGSSRPPMKRNLDSRSLNSRATRAKTSTSKNDVPFLTVSDDDEGKLMSFKLFSIVFAASEVHPAIVDNAVSMRSRELLEVIEKLRGECDVKEHKANLERMMLESQKWASYQASLSTLESQIASLEAENARLVAVKVSFQKEVDDVKRDRMEVVSKVVPYAAMELIHDDDLGSLVKGYRPSYKKDHDHAGNDLATTTFPWLSEFVADPSAPVEVLLSKKPPSL